jgi:ferric-dicitrate binding protein FerR (iron transport regulator)
MRQPRWRRLRDALVLGLAAVFLTTAAGCFGRFRAMNAVYDFNRTASDNAVVRSLLLFAMLVVPVYAIAFLADWIVLNTLDFLNGTNKVAVQTLPDGSKVELAKLDADTVRVRQVDPAGREASFDIVRVGANAGYLRGPDGRIVGSVERLSDGRLVRQAR